MKPIYTFLDNLGHCRFSALSSTEDPRKKIFIEMIGRFAVGVLALFSLYDVIENVFPSPIKIVIHGPLIAIIASLGLSILLKSKIVPQETKKIPQVEKPKTTNAEPKIQVRREMKIQDPKEERSPPSRPVRRALLNELNEAAREANLQHE